MSHGLYRNRLQARFGHGPSLPILEPTSSYLAALYPVFFQCGPFWNFLKELSSYYTNLPLPLLPLNPLWLPSPTGGKFGPPGDTYRALHDPHTSPYPTSIAPVCATISSTLAGDFFALLLLYSLLPPIQSPRCSPRNFYKCRSHLGTSNSLLLP